MSDEFDTEQAEIPLELTKHELFSLSAVDPTFFNRTFFPKTFRQGTPNFHKEIDQVLEGSGRLVSLQIFRGAAKTSKLRAYGARRIAFGLARTILWVGKSQEHAIHSVNWLKKAIQFNRLYAETFQLSRGKKWQDVELEIQHGIEEIPIRVLAFGVSGSIRGVNIDDYRPDLIILDDILDEENTATKEQREKTENLVYGALKESLAPASEAPHAKMVMLQTPLNIEDLSMQTLTSREWTSARFGCWTQDTEDLPLQYRQSIWEERFPSEELRKEKEAAIAGNRLSIFTREKECRIITAESSAFRPEWLRFYDTDPGDELYSVLAIDPVPPPSDKEVAQGFKHKDSEALVVVSKSGPNYIVREISTNKGHDPSWTAAEFFRLARRYNVKRVVVESVQYQRTLAWILRQAMEKQRVYYPIIEYTDKRKKYTRILDALSGISSAGHLFVKPHMADLITQFNEYPNVKHDDVLDALSIAVSELHTVFELETMESILEQERKEMKKLDYRRGAP